MKATDLMIGDWIRFFSKYECGIGKVAGIEPREGSADPTTFSIIKDKKMLIGVSRNCVEPIAITAQILEKNGFRLVENSASYRMEFLWSTSGVEEFADVSIIVGKDHDNKWRWDCLNLKVHLYKGDGVHRYRYEQPFTIERICKDIEELGYSVQPIIIPACAVGAPHRRDRVFIVANANGGADGRVSREDAGTSGEERIQEWDEIRKPHLADKVRPEVSAVSQDTLHMGLQRDEELGYEPRHGNIRTTSEDGETQRTPTDTKKQQSERHEPQQPKPCRETQIELGRGNRKDSGVAGCGRWDDFPSVPAVHRGNDGLPIRMDRASIPFERWRNEALKAYGNAIVPQVMYEIFRAIQIVSEQCNTK